MGPDGTGVKNCRWHSKFCSRLRADVQARGRRDFFVETVGGHHYRCLHTLCIECRRARGRYDPTAGYGEMVTLIGGEIGIDDVAARLDR